MENSNVFHVNKYLFILVCTVAFLYLLISCIYEYTLDKDITVVRFKEFHAEEDNIHPSISLCFNQVFRGMNNVSDSIDYQSFLNGCRGRNCKWNASYSILDYDKVTKNPFDYILGEAFIFQDSTRENIVYQEIPYLSQYGNNKFMLSKLDENRVYVGYRGSEAKCITFDMPFRKNRRVMYHSILLNNDIFPKRTRPMIDGLLVSYHYPRQILRQTSRKMMWPNVAALLAPLEANIKNGTNKCGLSYTMSFEIDNVSILKRRNKKKHPCVRDWKNDDNEIRLAISKRIGCKPSQWSLSLNVSDCTSKQEMRDAWLSEISPSLPSCQAMERYSISYTEMPVLSMFNPSSLFKEIGYLDNCSSAVLKKEQVVVSEVFTHFSGTYFAINFSKLISINMKIVV